MPPANPTPLPYTFDCLKPPDSIVQDPKLVRGRIASRDASLLRALWLEGKSSPDKIFPFVMSYDGLTSRLVKEAGFPAIFIAGYAVSATLGLPDTGYIGFQDVANKIQEVKRVVDLPIMVDGDTGYGNPMNVRRTVQGFAAAGAAGVMIEDQTFPKRCGHMKGKSVVDREEAYLRVQAAVDARNEGQDMFILARTDAFAISYEEGLVRAQEFARIGADAVFLDAVDSMQSMQKLLKELSHIPVLASMVEGGNTELLSAAKLASMGFAAVIYPTTLIGNHVRSTRETLEELKAGMLSRVPRTIIPFKELGEAVGFKDYYELEERYREYKPGSSVH